MIANKPPCHNCKDRRENCHSNCENYKLYKKLREEGRKKKEEFMLIEGYCVQRCEKLRDKARTRRS